MTSNCKSGTDETIRFLCVGPPIYVWIREGGRAGVDGDWVSWMSILLLAVLTLLLASFQPLCDLYCVPYVDQCFCPALFFLGDGSIHPKIVC
jgi:hypothetical protein